MIRVLVIGADNFVGRPVVEALARSGWAKPMSVGEAPGFDQAIEMADSIVNCTVGRPQDIVGVSRRLFAAAGRCARAPSIVHLSSMTVYGSARGWVDEASPLLGDSGAYSQAQLEADRLAAQYPESIRLRPGCEFGPGCRQWTGLIADCLAAGRLGDLGAGGDGICNLLFIDDLVASILESLRRPQLRGHTFNLAMAAPPTWNEYLVAFAKALGAVPLRRVSRRRLAIETRFLAPPLKLTQMFLGRAGVGLHIPPPITPSLVSSCRQEIRLGVENAEKHLGAQWTSLEAGLQRASTWWRAERSRVKAQLRSSNEGRR